MVEPLHIDARHLNLESQLDTMLAGMISEGTWKIGDRLPAERSLSEQFGVSRNTLRSVLKRLEARGVVAIRRGSGCYVTALTSKPIVDPTAEDESFTTVMERFEAAYLLLPEVFALAAERMDTDGIQILETCVSELGSAVLEQDLDGIKDKSRRFFCTVADTTGNLVLNDVVHCLCASSSLSFPSFFSFPESVRTRMFADFVQLFHSLKNRDPDGARQAVKDKIVNTASAFSKLKGIPLPPILILATTHATPREGDP